VDYDDNAQTQLSQSISNLSIFITKKEKNLYYFNDQLIHVLEMRALFLKQTFHYVKIPLIEHR